MNLQKLFLTQQSYKNSLPQFLASLKQSAEPENQLRNVVLFCKQVFSSNANQRKKYLCLLFIKDIFQSQVNCEHYEKLVDQYLAQKVYNIIMSFGEGKEKFKGSLAASSKILNQQKQYTEKTYQLALQTLVFWSKRLSTQNKSTFSTLYLQLKKSKIELPSEFVYYKKQMLIQLWKSDNNKEDSEDNIKFQNPILSELNVKFKECKTEIQRALNDSVVNDKEVNTRTIVESLRSFLLAFYERYREMESQQTPERNIIILYFHILNNLYKRLCNNLHISIQQMILMTKQIFQAVYPHEYDSVDRMDMIQLAGVFKYNALTIFQRWQIHQRIQKEDEILGEYKFKINLEMLDKPVLPSGGSLQGNASGTASGGLARSRAGVTNRFARSSGGN